MADQPARVDDADGLFDLPVAEFVAARDDLARRLKDDGHGSEASHVKALRRPTLAAWAVNQVVRRDPNTWEAVTTAGEAARRAQRRALSGVADSGLREAGASRRRAIEAALSAAVDHLDAVGARPEGHLDDVAATLEAATGDAGVAEQVGAGMLSGPVAAPDGMAGLAALMSVPAGDGVEVDGDDGEGDDPVAEQRRAAIREVEGARARADTQARAARQARTTATELAAQATRAQEHARAARETAERADDEADAASRRATEGEQAAETAESAAAEAEQAAVAAREALDDLA